MKNVNYGINKIHNLNYQKLVLKLNFYSKKIFVIMLQLKIKFYHQLQVL